MVVGEDRDVVECHAGAIGRGHNNPPTAAQGRTRQVKEGERNAYPLPRSGANAKIVMVKGR